MSYPPKLTPEQRVEIAELAKDRSINYGEIAKMYGIDKTCIAKIARAAGIVRTPRKLKQAPKPAAADIEDQIEQARRHLETLLERRAELEIRFEDFDATTVIVHGITKRFIELGGIAKLREHITGKINGGGR